MTLVVCWSFVPPRCDTCNDGASAVCPECHAPLCADCSDDGGACLACRRCEICFYPCRDCQCVRLGYR